MKLTLCRDDPAREDAPLPGMIGRHPTMRRLFREVRRAAIGHEPVLIVGETGTGKELVARALHQLGPQPAGPFVPVNVAAIPEGLFESELFGTVKGAYTGATCDRAGLVHAAAGGTLFLDEAGDMPAGVQLKLLRVTEGGEVRRLGASGLGRVRFRLVVSIQQEPRALVAEGRWRRDLYYRLTALLVRLPPLRDRRSDIALLTESFRACHGLPEVEPEAAALLEAHDWPGNVRELERALARAAFQSDGRAISSHEVRCSIEDSAVRLSLAPMSLREVLLNHVGATVRACGGDTQRASELLQISRTHVYRLLKRRDC